MAVYTTLQNGSSVIAWQTTSGISYQLLDPENVPITGSLVQSTPSVWTSVAPLSNGGFSIIWDSGFGAQPMAQDYRVNGAPAGAPYTLSGAPPTAPMASTSLELPTVTPSLWTTQLPNDDKIAVTTDNGNGFNPTLLVQQFDPAGGQIGSTYTQDFTGLGGLGDVVTTALANGQYVVTFTDSANFSAVLYADLFHADGTLAANSIVAQTSGPELFGPHATAALPDGGFVMTWVAQGGTGTPPPQALYVEEFGSDGSPVTSPQMLAFLPPVSTAPEIVALNNGTYTISWTPGGVGTPQVATFTEHGSPVPDYTNDAIFKPAAAYTLPVGPHEVTLVGNTAQTVTGNNLGDTIISNDYASTLIGGQGNDTLIAGHHANVLTGGGGSDKFVFPYLPDNAGQITDFDKVHDRIDISGILEGYKGPNPFANGTLTLNPDGNGGTELVYHPEAGPPVDVVDVLNVTHFHGGDWIFHH